MSDNDCSKNHGVMRQVSLLISLIFIGIPTERAFSLSMSNEQLSMNTKRLVVGLQPFPRSQVLPGNDSGEVLPRG